MSTANQDIQNPPHDISKDFEAINVKPRKFIK
jgi:hypothetical protein